MSQFPFKTSPLQSANTFFPLGEEKLFKPPPFKPFAEIPALQWHLAALPGCPVSLVVVIKEPVETLMRELFDFFSSHLELGDTRQKPSEIKDIHAFVSQLNSISARLELENLLPEPAIINPLPAAAKQKMLAVIHAVIDKNLDREGFHVAHLAKALNCCVMQLHRIVKNLTGHSAGSYIRHYRLQKSRELLRTGEYNICQTAYMVGFKSPEHFTRCFHKEFGETPSQCKLCLNAST